MHPAVAAYEAAYSVSDPEAIGAQVARAFTPSGVLMSPWLVEPVAGHGALAAHIVRTRKRLEGAVARHTSALDRVGNVMRWTWAFEVDGEVVSEGMDVAVLSDDERIELLAVFDGPRPPPQE
jgi:hypothetical protein